MKKSPILTLVAILLAASVCVEGAPPRVTGNRPATVSAKKPIDDRNREYEADDDPNSLLAALFPQEVKDEAAGDAKKSPLAELRSARERMLRVRSLSAKVVERVEVLDKTFKAEGRYLQTGLQDGDWKMRFELTVKIGNASGSMLEVCDGEVLWTRSEVQFGRSQEQADEGKPVDNNLFITRCNVNKVMNALKKLGDKTAEAAAVTSLGLGGMPALLASLEQSMKFTAVKEGNLRDLPMVIVEGTWNDSFLQRLRGAGGGAQPSTVLPPSAPDSVRVYLDRTTGFPHRILFLKNMLGRDVQKPMLTLDFLDVKVNEPINDAEFEYIPPPKTAPIERTSMLIEQINPEGAKKSGESGKGQTTGGGKK